MGGTGIDTIAEVGDIADIAREAGELLKVRFGDPGDVRGKGLIADQERAYDVVTELDFAAEKLIVGRIGALAPDAVVLAEEGGVSLASPGEPVSDLSSVDDLWVVDPLDGTINYANSLPGFAVSIGRYSRGEPVAGAIYDPLLDEMFTFARGDAARLNGTAFSVGTVEDVHEGLFGIGSAGRLFPDVVRQFRAWRRIGSAALSMAYVACGRFDAYATLGTLAPWDFAAGAPLIQAAGGVVSTPDLQEWDHPLDRHVGVVAANPALHRRLRELLR